MIMIRGGGCRMTSIRTTGTTTTMVVVGVFLNMKAVPVTAVFIVVIVHL